MESAGIESVMKASVLSIDSLLTPEAGKQKGKLWYSWHFLQVYSVWGLHMPNNEDRLKALLKLSSTDGCHFFPIMLQGLQKLFSASQYFQVDVFPKVIRIARDLLSFSKNASKNGEDFFQVIIQCLKDNQHQDAIDVIKELQRLTRINIVRATETQGCLASYQSKLEELTGIFHQATELVESDESCNSAFIEKANGDKSTEGSLAFYRSQIESLHDAYKEAVVVAATTPTYAFVLPPWGLIAASIVAGVYGSKATNILDAYHEAEENLAKVSNKLATAIKLKDSLFLAHMNLNNVLAANREAISHANDVKAAWDKILANLNDLGNKVSGMMAENDEEEKLNSNIIVKSYCATAGKVWSELTSKLEELVENPYITIQNEEMTPKDFIKEVEKHL